MQRPHVALRPHAAQRRALAEYAGRLGVGAATHVVVYDASDQGLYAAPRVWWMFRAFGHRTVSLLDGGLRHWLRLGLPLSSGKSRPAPAADFRAALDPAFVKTYEDLKENLESRRFQVVDARAAGRFRGTEPEPRDGIEPGHIPGTVNIPTTDFLTSEGLEKSPEEINRLFQDKKVDSVPAAGGHVWLRRHSLPRGTGSLPLRQARCAHLRRLLGGVVHARPAGGSHLRGPGKTH